MTPDDDSQAYYWAKDPYWTEALAAFMHARQSGAKTITLDVEAILASVFQGDGPAYRLLHAMASVKTHEGLDGHRGAPRLVLALLQRLQELDG